MEPATLAIARLDATGAASYEFYTDGTADWAWTDASLAPLIDGPFARHPRAGRRAHRHRWRWPCSRPAR